MKKIKIAAMLLMLCGAFISCNNTSENGASVLKNPIEERLSDYAEIDSTISVVATIESRGRVSSSSPSVAYVLLSNDEVLIFNETKALIPYTKEQAKVLLKHKANQK